MFLFLFLFLFFFFVVFCFCKIHNRKGRMDQTLNIYNPESAELTTAPRNLTTCMVFDNILGDILILDYDSRIKWLIKNVYRYRVNKVLYKRKRVSKTLCCLLPCGFVNYMETCKFLHIFFFKMR